MADTNLALLINIEQKSINYIKYEIYLHVFSLGVSYIIMFRHHCLTFYLKQCWLNCPYTDYFA
jgi:hypothetical protein